MSPTTLSIAKEKFKFSAAHFLIFNKTEAEKLHGHNYQVTVDILGMSTDEWRGVSGYLVDFNVIKKILMKYLAEWDEKVLLPQKHPEVIFREGQGGKNYDVTFRERFYSFPKEEVVWLPVINTSVELLSQLLAEKMKSEFESLGVRGFSVYVEESRGQGAGFIV